MAVVSAVLRNEPVQKFLLTNLLHGSFFSNEWSMWCDVAKDVIQAINILWVITGGLLQYKLHGIHVLRRGHVEVLLLCDDG